MQSYVELGARLKRFRERLGLSQKEFADLMGVTQGAVGHYESGRSKLNILDVHLLVERTGLPLSTISYELGMTDGDKPKSLYEVLAERERQGEDTPADHWRKRVDQQNLSRPWPKTLRRKRVSQGSEEDSASGTRCSAGVPAALILSASRTPVRYAPAR